MPGNPLLPSSIKLATPPPGTSNPTWQFLTYQGIREKADNLDDPQLALDPLFGIDAASVASDNWRRNACSDATAPLVVLPDGISLTCLTPSRTPSTDATIEFAVWLGWDSGGEETMRVSLPWNNKTPINLPTSVLQVSGRPFQSAQVYARLQPGGPSSLSVTLNVVVRQGGGAYQLSWGNTASLLYPLAAHTLP